MSGLLYRSSRSDQDVGGLSQKGVAPSSRAPRVLCYAPYNRWIQHAAWEMTIVNGLRARGADVRHVFCDGLYDECDVFWAASDPRTPLACTQCQAEVTRSAFSLQAPFEWLGRFLLPAELREARRWADQLPPSRFMTATFGEWLVGQWVEGSVHSHLRMTELDLDRPEVVKAYRGYLYSGLVACFGLTRLLDDVEPDVMLLFNGRLSSTRVALELARRRGIRVVVHERGLPPQTLAFFENGHCLSLAPIKGLWDDWGAVPLSRDQIEATRRHLDERAHGTGTSWPSFSPPPQDLDDLRVALRLSAARPLWVLFASSDDELMGEAEWAGPFTRQFDWIERTIAFAAAHPEIMLVLRVHPNTGGRRSLGRNVAQLERFEQLRQRLPANVRMVMPDDPVSSYALMDLATVGLVYQSTVGLEMACRGKAVVVATGSVVSGLAFVRTVTAAREYESMLDGLLGVPLLAVSDEVQRLAYRFAHAYFLRWPVPFPLVKPAENGAVGVTYTSMEELRPGADPHLDRVARIILDGAPICAPPGPADRLLSDADEVGCFRDGRALVGAAVLS